jgi:hypothetical protein
MPKPTELYTINNARIVNFARSGLAVLVTIDGEDVWLPFSEIREPDELSIRASRGLEIDIVIPAWMAKQKGLI